VEQRRKRLEERRADRQFAAYSPSLAAKVEKALRGTVGDQDSLTPTCVTAIARAHKTAEKPVEGSPLDTILLRLGLGSLAVSRGERP